MLTKAIILITISGFFGFVYDYDPERYEVDQGEEWVSDG